MIESEHSSSILGSEIPSSNLEAFSKKDTSYDIWTMNFDGATTIYGSGDGIVFTFPFGDILTYSLCLEFDCTNNIVEYESLFLVLI